MKFKKCFIFGAMENKKLPIMPDGESLVIAADLGLMRAHSHGIEPDIIIGDFDSLGTAPQGENVIKLPVRKDETDVGFAVKTAREKGISDLVLYGALGGGLDHTLANLQIASGIAEGGGSCLLIGDNGSAAVLSHSELHFEGGQGRLSVLCLSDKAEVAISGCEYSAEKIELTRSFPLGVSNAFKNFTAKIAVVSGTVAVLWECDTVPLIKH